MPRLSSAHLKGSTDELLAISERRNTLHAGISSSVIAVRSLVRGLSLLFAARPKTPLRVLCIMAFDTLWRVRSGKPLPRQKLRTVAALLDFGACANAAFDHKKYCDKEYRETWRLLEEAGIGVFVSEYLRRLRNLESGRPLPGGDDWQFQKAVAYREAVVRLSLGMLTATAWGDPCLNEAVRATHRDADINLLFRIVMQCQIVDDVLDYSKDLRAGLPSFLTAGESLSRAFELTRMAALGYADDRDLPPADDLFPLRAALFLVSACARLAIALGRWRRRASRGR